MKKNIIQILKTGNQELFYSSFFAWLLDPDGDHGLKSDLLTWFLGKIEVSCEVEMIDTELSISGGRADIVVKLKDHVLIIIENKTKSIGSNEQLFRYKKDSVKVIPMGLLRENFPFEQQNQVITYDEIINKIKQVEKRNSELSILVDHFVHYIELMLFPFNLFDRYCREEIELEEVQKELSNIEKLIVNGNDYRFFQAVYFERLLSYIRSNDSSLIFGTEYYYSEKKSTKKPNATKWIIEKNRQGPAFMEAIIYNPNLLDNMRLKENWLESVDTAETKDLSPRLEMWKGPYDIGNNDDDAIFQIGCWDKVLHDHFSSSGHFLKRGSRNFHYKKLRTSDLIYRNMVNIIKEEMGKIWEWKTGA